MGRFANFLTFKTIGLSMIVAVAFCGCTSSQLPKYLTDTHPYQRKFYTGFDQTLNASQEALEELGWEIVEVADPAIYEHNVSGAADGRKELLLFTGIRQTSLLVGTRYAKVNMYIRKQETGLTTVEIRYLTVNSLPFRNIETYHNDSAVERIFKRIAEHIG